MFRYDTSLSVIWREEDVGGGGGVCKDPNRDVTF